MGACGSKPRGCVGLSKKRNFKRRRVAKRRVSSHKLDKVDFGSSKDLSCTSSTIQGNVDLAWFDCISALESELDEEFFSVHDDEISNGGAGGDEAQALNHCGLLPNTCLPCLALTVPSVDKRRSLSPGTPGSRKKVPSRLSFKFREGHANAISFSPKVLLQRPQAGSSVPYCRLEKEMPDSWSRIEPNTFKVRGRNYFRDKKKDFAPNSAAFYPFGVDVFLSQRKIDHIARFVELPLTNTSEEIPSILVINLQIPLYPATIFQSENDGEGMSLVLYFKISENPSKELLPHFRENIIVN